MSADPRARIQQVWRRTISWLDERDLIAWDPGRVPWHRRFIHFWVLVTQSFVRNRCPLRASALTYSSLLAMIPMLALALSVTTSILKAQGEKPIRDFVDRLVASVTPYVRPSEGGGGEAPPATAEALRAREEAVKKIHEYISRAQTGAIGGTSAIILLFVAIGMLSRIEETFNDIWGVVRGRSWYMRVVLYWAAVTLGPVVLISALGLATAGQVRFSSANPLHFITDIPLVKSLISTYLPAVVLSLTFGMVYLLLPNTRVTVSAAAVGGLTAGLLWHVNNKLGVMFVSRITSNNAIYGSLGMVPVLMIGMYFGWLILLFGAQVAYAYQNRQAYLQERLAEGINQYGREFAALRLMTAVARRFHRGERPPTLLQLATQAGVPTRLAGQLLQLLSRARLVYEVYDRAPAYSPARPLHQITVHEVLSALRTVSGIDLATRDDAVRAFLQAELDKVRTAEKAVAGSLTLQALVEQVDTPAEGPPTRA